MARIVFCANTAWNLANFRAPIIDALLARGHEVVVVAGRDGSEDRLRDRGCRVVSFSIDSKGINPLRDLALIIKLRNFYARQRPDVILNFTIKAVIYGTLSAKLIKIPVINTITGLGTAFIENNWLTHVVQGLYRWSLPGPQSVIFQNEEDLALFKKRRLVTTNSITIVAGSGIDLKKFQKVPVPRLGPVTFLFIGRLLRDKGVCEFVEAARDLATHYPGTGFQLLGPLGMANRSAISAEEVSKWIDEGTIEYLGTTDDVRPFIKQAHCIVLPSYREGMPRALLEAAAMGRPLISTNVTGCREVVRHGINGYLCVPRDAADLALRMRNFIDLPYRERQRMGKASRSIAEERFDVRKVVKTYLELIDLELVRRSTAREVGKTADIRL
jgi:glycosyltransferase involved in cell wall biosynthesis